MARTNEVSDVVYFLGDNGAQSLPVGEFDMPYKIRGDYLLFNQTLYKEAIGSWIFNQPAFGEVWKTTQLEKIPKEIQLLILLEN